MKITEVCDILVKHKSIQPALDEINAVKASQGETAITAAFLKDFEELDHVFTEKWNSCAKRYLSGKIKHEVQYLDLALVKSEFLTEKSYFKIAAEFKVSTPVFFASLNKQLDIRGKSLNDYKVALGLVEPNTKATTTATTDSALETLEEWVNLLSSLEAKITSQHEDMVEMINYLDSRLIALESKDIQIIC